MEWGYTNAVLKTKGMKKMVRDVGFEPTTSTV